MERTKKFGLGAVICILMLVSTGFSSASKTTTIHVRIQELRAQAKDSILEQVNALNMTNNTKEQLVRVLCLIMVNSIGWFLVFKLRTFKILSAFIAGVIIGFDSAVIPAVLFNLQRQPQNETNTTL